METEERGAEPHVRRPSPFYVPFAVEVVLFVTGVALLAAGSLLLVFRPSRDLPVDMISIGVLVTGRMLIERWRFHYGYGPLRDWRPGRRMYFAPLVGFCVGLSLALAVHGHASIWIGVGAALMSVSLVSVPVIAIRRGLLDTSSSDDH